MWAGPDAFVIQAGDEGEPASFCYLYEYRLPASRELDRLVVDLAGLHAFAVQPEL